MEVTMNDESAVKPIGFTPGRLCHKTGCLYKRS